MVSTDEKQTPKKVTDNSNSPSPSHFAACSHAYVDLTGVHSSEKRDTKHLYNGPKSISLVHALFSSFRRCVCVGDVCFFILFSMKSKIKSKDSALERRIKA